MESLYSLPFGTPTEAKALPQEGASAPVGQPHMQVVVITPIIITVTQCVGQSGAIGSAKSRTAKKERMCTNGLVVCMMSSCSESARRSWNMSGRL